MKLKCGIVITTFDRPEYLGPTLNSLSQSVLPKGTEIYLVDDASTHPDTKRLIEGFSVPGIHITKTKHTHNHKTMTTGLKEGFSYFFNKGFDVVTNIDSDAIVKPYWLNVLLKLYKSFPANIITGFNTNTHPILEHFPSHCTKRTAGGINLMFDKMLYYSIVDRHLKDNNWDNDLCDEMKKHNKLYVVSVPSVVEHIGIYAGIHSCGGFIGCQSIDFQ